MARLGTKVQHALDETRMLVLGAQVLQTSWYGVELVGRRLTAVTEQTEMEKTRTSDKIRHVLTEARASSPPAGAPSPTLA